MPRSTPDYNSDNLTPTTIAQVTGTQYVVTLALSPEQSERFVFATEFGKVWLSLDPASVADDGTRPVTLSDVYRGGEVMAAARRQPWSSATTCHPNCSSTCRPR